MGQRVTALRNRSSNFRQDALPVDAEADAGGIFQQPGSFLLLGELGELPMQWMLRGEERFLTVKDRRVGSVAVIIAASLPCHKIHDDRFSESGVRIFFEIWIGEERDLRRGSVEFQQVEPSTDFQTFPQFCHGDPKQGRDALVIARIDQIHRTRQALAEWQRVEGLAVFDGGHARMFSLPEACASQSNESVIFASSFLSLSLVARLRFGIGFVGGGFAVLEGEGGFVFEGAFYGVGGEGGEGGEGGVGDWAGDGAGLHGFDGVPFGTGEAEAGEAFAGGENDAAGSAVIRKAAKGRSHEGV
jgi:hypothetical protein